MALPCLALALLVLVATRDPARGRLEAGLQEHFRAGGEYNERLNLNGLRMLAKSPTVLLVLVQGIPGTLPWGVITVFLPDYLHKQRGMSIKTATVVGMMFGAATVAGQVVGAKVGQSLYNRRPRNQALLMGMSTIAGTLPCVMMIRYSGGVFGVYAVYAMAGGFLAAMTGPNIRSVLMNVTLPSTRGTAFGVFNVFDDLGKGLGPAMVSLVVASRGREDAFTLAILGWLACGTMLLAMALTVHRDEQKVHFHLAEY
ncbi:MFS family transporter: sugar [Ectocarpus siliculosus]|uniref:MFS family transporter: sugar n=1 Tax=Ectocarpus siliculosus TaxID=2880 RepID=D7G3X7_ECTSI|nr:MFS family transporter: sugar [Ectocarpus siliculosus]|eukprot:CBJ27012.1 MFS family transporter: sugar [Ectocarpus siliculosus]